MDDKRREQIRLGNLKRRRKLREISNKHKDRPCADCGLRYPPYVMDLDHQPGFEKTANVARMISAGYAESRVREELEKCEVVCANCHRIRTHADGTTVR